MAYDSRFDILHVHRDALTLEIAAFSLMAILKWHFFMALCESSAKGPPCA